MEYDKISGKLNGLGKGIYSVCDELVAAINTEIRRLRAKIEGLRWARFK